MAGFCLARRRPGLVCCADMRSRTLPFPVGATRRRRLLAAALLLPGLARAQEPPVLRVGSKNFTEQLVVGELYAQALEAAGARVERQLNLGGTLIAQQALLAGQIDLYPEYTGTGLGVVLRASTEGSAAEVYRRVREGYEREFGLTWLAPSGIDNGNALLVLPETARRYGLATLSDLARAAPQLTLAAGNEFAGRADGLPGLVRVYGIHFRRFRQFAALGLRYAALRHGQADVVNAYATDWQIATGGFVVLRDDRGLWPPYQLAPVVRPEAMQRFPPLEAVLAAVNARLDNPVMQELNRQVDQDGDEPREVAARFLAQPRP
ncbi:glycine betaine ABC transporter substrate-binding protein [Siccirubricoccus sp. G192]|uniref:glycine betaine ABC transporter substrate-binding protein n=1 Tax=Siccirubricoccus sp. G192 TaxID=2849651 RepID=UPI001C2BE551|nr:glycine betaine ABC transporter substrate-binding protein [Siccirubricoccus sp. G192]MBV1799692.1 glycine/betaine ABC transporter substrate-binding protein [Siccirubricoccus sp. G192]